MPRLMSVAMTEPAVVARRKTVTRRSGWTFLQPGTELTLVRKAMGRTRRGPDGVKHTEPLVRLAEVRVTEVRCELLSAITAADVTAEGFPGWTPWQFVQFFTEHMGGHPDQTVTRIEWEYL